MSREMRDEWIARLRNTHYKLKQVDAKAGGRYVLILNAATHAMLVSLFFKLLSAL
jgi:hypothetical protein